MDLFEDICPLFNLAMAIMSIAQLRFVAWQDILKAAAAAAAATVSAADKKNDQEQEDNEDNNKQIRIRTILSSFQQGTAPACAEQALLLELKEYFTSSSNNTTTTTDEKQHMLFGCHAADLEMAVTTLLLPQTMTQLLDCITWYDGKSKEFRSFLKRPGVGSMDFHTSLLEMKNIQIVSHDDCQGQDNTDTTAAGAPPPPHHHLASARRRFTKTAATTSSSSSSLATSIMLVACNNYRVDTGPSGKELIYMIYLDKCHERIIVTFRGSITLSDWAHDVRVNTHSMNNPFFDAAQEQTGGGGGGASGSSSSSSLLQERQHETLRIHAGFYQYLCMADRTNGEESKLDQILRKLNDLLKQHPTYKVVVAGHSLGGAASTLFAFMAAAAATSAATRGDHNKHKRGDNDNADNSGDNKDLSERFRMWLPTPSKVARLFGGATAAAAATAASAPQEPPSATQEDNHDDNNDDNQAKDEADDSRMHHEGSCFQICLPTPITVVSFGSPTVGDEAFCRAFRLLEDHGILRHLRVANEDDIVPSIPVSSIPTTLERVYLYRHTGIPLLQLSHAVPVKQLFRLGIRKMSKQNQIDTGADLFRICHGDRKKMKKHLDRNNNNSSASDWQEDVAVVAQDFANAVGGLHLRTPIHHLPASYHKRLQRIEVYLRRLSLDQLYQEYLDLNQSRPNGNDDDDDKNNQDEPSGGVVNVQQVNAK